MSARKPERSPARRSEPATSPAHSATEGSKSARASTASDRRASAASYAALVAAEIARHKHYPAGAKHAGTTGSVGVAFTIGSGGSIVSHTIVRSSGYAVLDNAVHAMMRGVHLPPPPGGHFSSSVTVRFNLQ
ncbi:MAG: energy transducer TonB [Phyllobacteriaceae bacterium]|nr:energy transducer TonB [Phyllobacteriaceae bacterium]